MSTTIDNRVVEMQFDNRQFERNVETSLSTLDKLKQGLNLSSAAKGLESIGTAAKGINLSAISYAAETVGLKFNAMYTIADQALRNITNSAVNAGKRIVSALTVDPIKTGFQEYETQINAIQTILSNTRSKGSTLEDVNTALDQLNTYADKTIYNFTEMTRNIGTFTAAGVDLDTSVNSIKGIANLAAVSGSTSQQASTAMYQLSQALAAGKVQLMDWNSVVNAGMGGQLFQDALKRTATNMGTNVDAIIKKYGSFRESLSKGEWLTAEVLTETLTQLSGAYTEADLLAKGYTQEQTKDILALANDAVNAATKVKTFTQLWDTLKESAQSGWTQTWEIIVGDFEQARSTLTKVSDVIGEIITESAEARNTLLKGWKENGGRDDIIRSFKNIFQAVQRISFHIKSAFTEIFPPVTVVQLVNLTRSFAKFTEKLKLSGSQLRSIKSIFKGVFALLDIGRMAFVALWDAIKPLFGGVGPLGNMLLKLGDGFGKWAVSLRDSIKESGIFNKTMQTVSEVIQNAITKIQDIIAKIKNLYDSFTGKIAAPAWMEPVHNVLDRIKERFSEVKDAAGITKNFIISAFENLGNFLESCSFFKVLETLWNGILKLGSGIGKALGTLTGGLFAKLENGSFIGFFDTINTMIAGGVGVGIMKFLDSATGTFTSFKDVVGNVVDIFDGVRGCFEAYQSSLKAKTLMEIAKAIALLAAAIVVISLIDSVKLSQSLGAITILFADLMGSMAIFGKSSGTFKGVAKACAAISTLARSLLILSIALKIMSTMSWKEMGVGLISLVVGLGALVTAVNFLPNAKVKKAASAIKTMAYSMVVLAVAIKIMSTMSWKEMGVGLISLVVGLGALVAAVNLLPKDMAVRSFGMISLATAMVILGAALKVMGSMSWKEMGVGLISLAGSMTVLVVAMNLMRKAIPGAAAMLIVAPALVILASALKIMGSMSWKEMGVALISLAGSMVVLAVALTVMQTAIPGAAAMLIVAPALLILASALKIMGGMSWGEIAKGLVALAGSMIIMTVALTAMVAALPGAAAMLIVSAALAIFTPQLLLLGTMSWGAIVKGLVALAGAFAVIGVAGYLLSPIAPAIMAMAVSFAAIGVGIVAVGAGMLLVAAGFTALSTAVSVGGTALMAGLAMIILGIADLIPAVAVKLAEGIVRFAQVIADGSPVIGEAVKNLTLTIIEVLVECIPVIVDGALKLIVGVLKALVKYTPTVIDLLFDFIVAALRGLAERIPDLIQVAFEVVMSVFEGVIDALSGIDVNTLVKGIAGIGIMSGIMAALSAVAALVPGAMVGVLGVGAVIAEMALVLAAVGALAQIPGLEWLINEGGQFLQSIGTAIGQFIGGIVGGVAQGFTASLPQIGSDLSEFMTNATPFIEGLKMVDSTVLESAGMLAGVIIAITAADIISGVTSFLTGGSSFAEFGSQLAGLGTSLNEFATNLGNFDEAKVTTVNCAVRAIKAISDVANELPNEGGWLAKLVGDNSIATFGGYLPDLGTNLSEFASNLGTFTDAQTSTISCAASAIKEMATAASDIPNEGGWFAKLVGDSSIATFGGYLPDLGTNLGKFASNLGTFTDAQASTVECAAKAIKVMADVANTLPNEGGWLAAIVGDNSVSQFGGYLPDLGTNLGKFASNLGTFNKDKVETVKHSVDAVKAFSGLANADLSGAKKHLGDFGEKIVGFASDIKSFVTGLPTRAGILNAIADINAIITLVKNMAAVDANSASKFTASLSTIAQEGVTKFVDALSNAASKTKVQNAAAELVTAVVTGIDKTKSKILTAFKDAVADGPTAIRGQYYNFYNAGYYLVEGLKNGISENSHIVTAQARSMALAARIAAETALGIASPSKVFYRIGAFTGEGFVNALDDYGESSYKAGSNIANLARNGLTEAIGRIGEIIDNNVDTQPTIRPVLDLTGVRSGANAIGDLLNNDASMGVVANVGSINSMMNRRSQNGDNFEVVNAIDKLRKEMANTDRASYSINGISYNDDAEVSDAIKTLVRHAKIERRK